MCGIGGFYGNFRPDILETMNRFQRDRGPDDAGTWHDSQSRVGLIQTRLSIIDLSAGGHQPMWDAEQRAVITYNGEIYNYQELRGGLQKEGYRFKSTSDTEVILNLYLRDGVDCLSKLNGIFAFALWDARTRELLVARDGLGVKPFYYAVTANGFVFASEIKALLQTPGLDRSLDPEGILSYIAYLYSPCPHTPLKSVRKLPPGHAAWVTEKGIENIWQFYRLPYDQPIQKKSPRLLAQELRSHLNEAVRRQMVADVPVGAFLSGGLDSSSVVAFAKQYAPEGKIDCFTIGFRDGTTAAEGMADDLPYARNVARHLGVDLHVIEVGSDMASRFEEMIWHLDEPQADPAPLNVLFICELARQHGIKVLLSGGGGDDIFTGYRRHYALMQERYWAWLPQIVRRQMTGLTGFAPAAPAWGRRLRKAFQYAGEPQSRRIASYFLWLEPSRLGRLMGERFREELKDFDPLQPLLAVLDQLPPDTHPLNRMLALDASFFLTDHNLNYTDKMSMARGVEVRVPFLDPDLVAFAARLPPEYKQRGRVGKWIFKKAMEPILPKDVIYRPKTGFGAPLRQWLRKELRDYVEDLLSERTIRNRGLFDAKAVKALVEMDRRGKMDAAYPIFALMCIELWCRLFVDRGHR